MVDRDPDPQSYLDGVDLLCAGRALEALPALERVPEADRTFERRLALAKVHLELERGEDAARCLEPLVRSCPDDPGTRSLLGILLAAARARAGRREEARADLESVAALDPRLERAARALRKRIDQGAPPIVRL
jgi:Flp pilus assembly protein TadD